MKKLLTPEHVALLLCVPIEAVHDIVAAGKIHFYCIGEEQLVRFSEQHVIDYLADNDRVLINTNEMGAPPISGPTELPSLDLDEPEPKKPLKHLSLDDEEPRPARKPKSG